MEIDSYAYHVRHRKGTSHVNADALPRLVGLKFPKNYNLVSQKDRMRPYIIWRIQGHWHAKSVNQHTNAIPCLFVIGVGMQTIFLV